MRFDIIGDIHGQYDKLVGRLIWAIPRTPAPGVTLIARPSLSAI
jgi:hypothetical protein